MATNPDITLADPAPRVPTDTRPGRDGFLDSIKGIALWRVVVWHALAWPWLSWFAAMPAMFYVAGNLLERSLDRHGYGATVVARFRRLLIPFWAFGLASAAIMLLAGWRPEPDAWIGWIVPLVDPAGLDSTPGLWVPLWYLRAYLWIVVAGAALSWLCRRFGPPVLLVPVATTLGVWALQGAGHDVPLSLADAALFPLFVMAGMLAAQGRLDLAVRRSRVVAGVGALLAVAWYQYDGAPGGIVNGSLPLHLLVGVATIGALSAVRPRLSTPPPVAATFVRWSTSRALTIYLWHGLGLVVADRVVHDRDLHAVPSAAAGLAVVVLVTLACATVFGPLEDVAASRRIRAARPLSRAVALPGAVLVAAALLAGDSGDEARLVPSGQAVLDQTERAEVVEGDVDDLADRGSGGATLDEAALEEALTTWEREHADHLAELGATFIEVALVDGTEHSSVLQWTHDDRTMEVEPFPWLSMTKSVTATWMMQLADDGIIDIAGSLDEQLPGVPHGDELTFERLASHRSGIPSSLDGPLLDAAPVDEVERFFEDPELAYAPGDGYEYSRIGYHLLTWGLEEASGSAWTDAVASIADRSGAELIVDEDILAADRVTHPGDGDYRGGLWGAAGLHGTTVDGARLFRWALMEGLPESSVRRMAEVHSGSPFYGLGLAPLCPCVTDDDGRVASDRVGLSTGNGTYVVDLAHDVGLMLRSDGWWIDDGPNPAFEELLHALLDTSSA